MYEDLPAALHLTGSLYGTEFVGLCPIHGDRHPSFSFNITTGLWICYTQCGGGNATQLLQKLHPEYSLFTAERELLKIIGETQRDAIRRARRKEEGREEEGRSESSASSDPSEKLRLIEAVPQWFLSRGFSRATGRTFGLRYDQHTKGLYIPVGDGYVLRLPPGDGPKYVNSHGLDQPYGPLVCEQQRDPLVLVEGPLDALWVWETGWTSLALLGGRVTEQILDVIAAEDPSEICLATDNDLPGIKLGIKLFIRLTQRGYRVTQIELPEAVKDVQELTHGELDDAIRRRSSPIAISQNSLERIEFGKLANPAERTHNG